MIKGLPRWWGRRAQVTGDAVVDARMLVTGATGVVGHEVVARAQERGWKVVGCAASGGPGVVAWPMGQGPPPHDLAGPWDVIVHCAARPRFDLTPEDAYASNVIPLKALTGL